MKHENQDNSKQEKYTQMEKLKAAYALNMCTVSVSQIIRYKDAYILEQEYDAILNNLNLKEMPKDEALLRILSELLNTITYFRIQDIKKKQIERKYQRRIKNAIWSAVPSLSVIVSGNPVAIALSIATQVGTGYMNYRKEKCNALADKEDAEIELQITAIEQLNALRRELFTTAWRLADEYDFNDDWRLTEKQIAQYNEILMDGNDFRKYRRLESIQDKFKAYPPFWYFFGHTANYIAEVEQDLNVKKVYRELAKQHFEYFYSLSKYSILREDQLTASCALEYVDILWNEENRDIDKITALLDLAVKMAGNSLDVLQLCAISYLKIGISDQAIALLKNLVNEDYNRAVNVKLLSRLYVSQYLFCDLEHKKRAYTEYRILPKIAGETYLFPMPDRYPDDDAKKEDQKLLEQYIENQKRLIYKEYRLVINEFIRKCMIEYNKLWPVPDNARKISERYFACDEQAKGQRYQDIENALNGEEKFGYIAKWNEASFSRRYLDLLNKMLESLDELTVFRDYEGKYGLLLKIRRQIVKTRDKQKEFQNKVKKGILSFDDYVRFQDTVSFQVFTEEFFDNLRKAVKVQLENSKELCEKRKESEMEYLDTVEMDLIEFCSKYDLKFPSDLDTSNIGRAKNLPEIRYFEYSILGSGIAEEAISPDKRDKVKELIEKSAGKIITDSMSDVKMILEKDAEFDAYFANENFVDGWRLKHSVIGILDDRTKKDQDLLLCYNRVILVTKNEIFDRVPYGKIRISTSGNKEELKIGYPGTYSNKNVNIAKLYNLIKSIATILQQD